MDSGLLIKRARRRAGLSQRALADRCATSHATIAMYETGTKIPRVDTLDRILRAAGFEPEITLAARADTSREQREAKGRELVTVLDLAAQFPSRRRARRLPPPVLR